MGDTALIRGVAAEAKRRHPAVRIIGVQATQAPSYFRSWHEDRVVTTDTCDTIADGLATSVPFESNVRAIRELVDEVCLVSDDEMLQGISTMLFDEHLVAEAAGAAAPPRIFRTLVRMKGAVSCCWLRDRIFLMSCFDRRPCCEGSCQPQIFTNEHESDLCLLVKIRGQFFLNRSLGAKRDQRIDLRRASRGEVARE